MSAWSLVDYLDTGSCIRTILGYCLEGMALHEWDLLADHLLDSTEVFGFVWSEERDCFAFKSGSPCASNTVDVGFRLVWHVVVDNIRQLGYIYSSSSNVGSDKNTINTILKIFKSDLPC